jgi:hypothetical protein
MMDLFVTAIVCATTYLCWNWDTEEEMFILYSKYFFLATNAIALLFCFITMIIVLIKNEATTLILKPIDLLPQHIPFSQPSNKSTNKDVHMSAFVYDRMKISYYVLAQMVTSAVAWFSFQHHQYISVLLLQGAFSFLCIVVEEFVWYHMFFCCCNKKVRK